MTAIDDLLAQSLLLQDPQVPSDTIAYEDTAYPASTGEGTSLWDGYGHDPVDDAAAQRLRALCEAAVAHCAPGQLADFITDQLPAPRGAWILGCVLQLADASDGARFWWQYAAGAGDPAASYCLHLHHLASGDVYAAAFWQEQTGSEAQQDSPATGNDRPTYDLNANTSIPTVLHVLSRLASVTRRKHTETTAAVIDFVAAAVASGYDLNPDCEIPTPGEGFAEQLEIIIAATLASTPSTRHSETSARTLPHRPPHMHAIRSLNEKRAQQPETSTRRHAP
ncbi:hypothetical protein GCM10010145_59620 [Streptomyces ruber]|uniref:Uncharacterized protein n=2 Tax=Streptomyces TaxID=1883 RepID=A0A918BNA4_9ACTN|nr:hypothetical protein [Streptomyces ruber]GGQ82074.1 hypothetical protein GCM10010145_59620 [Streptomyces ruber]